MTVATFGFGGLFGLVVLFGYGVVVFIVFVDYFRWFVCILWFMLCWL